jgi:hypothetical protein
MDAHRMNDAVIFRSGKFSLVPPRSESGRLYDLPLGDDLSAFLIARMTASRPAAQFSPVTREDFGSVFDMTLDGRTYILTVTWLADRDHEDRWGIQFSHPVGLLGAVIGRRSRPEACRTAQNLVADALSAHPETFANVEWLTQDEFNKRV